MSQKTDAIVASIIGIDTGKSTLHLLGLDDERAIASRQKLGRSQMETRIVNVSHTELAAWTPSRESITADIET